MAEGISPIRGQRAIGQFWRAAISQAQAAGAGRISTLLP